MNASEALLLCKYTQACCPQQKFDTFTPDAWGDLLADMRFDDCKTAVANIARRQPFVSPSEIIAEVRRIRRARLDATPIPDPPGNMTPVETIARAKRQRELIMDGGIPESSPELPARPDRIVGSCVRTI